MKAVFILSILLGVGYGASVHKENPGDCPEICPQIYTPVCASDGIEFRVFSNDCQLTAFNCWQLKDFQILRAGLCEEEEGLAFDLFGGADKNKVQLQDGVVEEKDCQPCPKSYVPVCGIDGEEKVTFGNKCMMDFTNCEESRKFIVLKDGEC